MRMLDNQGANTGYPYKMPNIFRDQIPTYPAVQYPPIVPGMEGPPSDTDRSKITNSKREAWFINTQVTEQRISTKTTRKTDEVMSGEVTPLSFYYWSFKLINESVISVYLTVENVDLTENRRLMFNMSQESVGKGSGKRFAPFDSVVSPAGSRSGIYCVCVVFYLSILNKLIKSINLWNQLISYYIHNPHVQYIDTTICFQSLRLSKL